MSHPPVPLGTFPSCVAASTVGSVLWNTLWNTPVSSSKDVHTALHVGEGHCHVCRVLPLPSIMSLRSPAEAVIGTPSPGANCLKILTIRRLQFHRSSCAAQLDALIVPGSALSLASILLNVSGLKSRFDSTDAMAPPPQSFSLPRGPPSCHMLTS